MLKHSLISQTLHVLLSLSLSLSLFTQLIKIRLVAQYVASEGRSIQNHMAETCSCTALIKSLLTQQLKESINRNVMHLKLMIQYLNDNILTSDFWKSYNVLKVQYFATTEVSSKCPQETVYKLLHLDVLKCHAIYAPSHEIRLLI